MDPSKGEYYEDWECGGVLWPYEHDSIGDLCKTCHAKEQQAIKDEQDLQAALQKKEARKGERRQQKAAAHFDRVSEARRAQIAALGKFIRCGYPELVHSVAFPSLFSFYTANVFFCATSWCHAFTSYASFG
jgi:hypothetical protein